ncbi:MAG: methyltransferase domain-containing protein [Chitinophagaceae bacterium]|nr:methyltransferase domain-containing protein [Chitinophagaceae bacterium]
MERIRKPFQGIWNIIRFNWHFYILSGLLIFLACCFNTFLQTPYYYFINVFCLLVILTTIISLLVSFYVYDLSGLYKLNWLEELMIESNKKIVNINAGFDETSILLKAKFPNAELVALDFYDPKKHTEISIKRARKAYPPFPGTKQVNTSRLSLKDNYADAIFVILSAHEIRNEQERNIFFCELKRILQPDGKIIVTEHLRDIPNFLAYNIGFFHFMPKVSWYKTFTNAGLHISKEIKITPFITTFILEKYGNTN